MIDRAVTEIELNSAFEAVRISLDLADAMPSIVADPEQLGQAIANVLINAAEAMGGDGEVRVASRLTGDRKHARLTITDAGPGVDPAVLAHAFEPFVTTKTDRRGEGLGLAVAHGVVQAHGGEIEIANAPGGGAVVTMTNSATLRVSRPSRQRCQWRRARWWSLRCRSR